jgi:hypothetical protein
MLLILSPGALLVCAPPMRAQEIEAVASKVSKDYVRKKLPDGKLLPKTYVFGKGDNWGGARVDPTIDTVDFMDVARVLAGALANRGYLPATDPKAADELIMVSWGTTQSPEHATESNTHMRLQQASEQQARALEMLRAASKGTHAEQQAAKQNMAAASDALLSATIGVQAENQRREDTDMRTATLLGYDSWWVATNAAMDGSPLGRRKQDMRGELEEDRYFVVLMALDYPTLVAKKTSKFLWEVRFSIREHGTAFDKNLEGMVAKASQYFGRDSGGLQHITVPPGTVIVGPVESLGVVPEK